MSSNKQKQYHTEDILPRFKFVSHICTLEPKNLFKKFFLNWKTKNTSSKQEKPS